MEEKTLYDYTIKDRAGNDVSLSIYKGKVLLILNSATGCGFTPQYKALEEMYRQLKDNGFEILDFPCNQFASQAPGSDEKIHTFCTLKYDIGFAQFKKIEVNGENADPLFVYLSTLKPFVGFDKGLKNKLFSQFAKANNKKFKDKAYIKWNFTKFLIDRNGNLIERFEPTTNMDIVKEKVIKLLNINSDN